MAIEAYVYGIGGGCAFACEACKRLTDETREERTQQGFDVPEFYGPTVVPGDAVCGGCWRPLNRVPRFSEV